MKEFVFSPSFLENDFDAGWDRLFMKYWRHQVLQDANRLDGIVQDDQGNEYYTAWQYTKKVEPYVENAMPVEFATRKLEQLKEEERQAREAAKTKQ